MLTNFRKSLLSLLLFSYRYVHIAYSEEAFARLLTPSL